jgi:leucyl-tRNA synthetase
MNSDYKDLFQDIEKKAQESWKNNSFTYRSDKKNYYILSMFPYPSGNLHMGHVRNYVLGDVVARMMIMSGYNVLHPMGWDAFGLPAENASIRLNISPQEWTKKNIENMKAQFISLGIQYNWEKELSTCDPQYYKHQQWFFIQLYNAGLIKREKGLVYWDPVDKTVLANEQVIDGRGWRSNSLVEHKEIEQWVIKVDSFVNDLYDNISLMKEWPRSLINTQKQWIGKKEGYHIDFPLVNNKEKGQITVFTTVPEALHCVQCIVLSIHHPIIVQLSHNNYSLKKFVETHQQVAANRSEINPLGIKIDLQAINLLTGENIDIYCANYVDSKFATGAVMCCPAVNEIDKQFVHNMNIPYQENQDLKPINLDTSYIRKTTAFRLTNWGISRQRYWGCPIPMVYCSSCGIVPEKEENLPVLLPLFKENYSYCSCPICGKKSERERDTMDTFVDSSWYYARFTCNTSKQFLSQEAKSMIPVDLYIGGIEHATLHFLYVRLFHRFMKNFGFLKGNEPFKKILTQGMIFKDGSKMSKSKGNIVDPQIILKEFGADTLRLFIMYAAPPEKSFEWSDRGVIGTWRLCNKILSFINYKYEDTSFTFNSKFDYLFSLEVNNTINHFLDYKFNKVVASYYKLLNLMMEYKNSVQKSNILIFLRLLYPIAPHLAYYLWKEKSDIALEPFPQIKTLTKESEIFEIIICINGIKKGILKATIEQEENDLVQIAKNMLPDLDQNNIIQTVYVAKKIINFVLKKDN